jgi:hypothetical protein
MRITKEDIGRKVILRNGQTTVIDFFYKSSWPVKTSYDSWHRIDGKIFSTAESPEDIVSFLENNSIQGKKLENKMTKKIRTTADCKEILESLTDYNFHHPDYSDEEMHSLLINYFYYNSKSNAIYGRGIFDDNFYSPVQRAQADKNFNILFKKFMREMGYSNF